MESALFQKLTTFFDLCKQAVKYQFKNYPFCKVAERWLSKQ
jgi:hypothetical protein